MIVNIGVFLPLLLATLMTMFGAFGFFWYSGENLTKKEDFTSELLALLNSKNLTTEFDLLVKFSAGLAREQTAIYIQTKPEPTEIEVVEQAVSYDIGVGVPFGCLILSIIVDIIAAVYCFAKCGFKKEFYWAKMSSIITIQVYLHLCALLTFAAYIQQTLRLSEYPFAPQNLGFGFWAILVSFLIRCLIWTMVSCCPAGCRPCLTINGEKLEELQAEAILNLVKGIEDDATTVNDESEMY